MPDRLELTESRDDGPLTTKVIKVQEAFLEHQERGKREINDLLEGAWVLATYPYSTIQRIGYVTRVDLIHGEFVFLLDMVHWRAKSKIDYPRDPQTGMYKRLLGPGKSGSHFRMRHVKFLDRPKAIPGVDFYRRRSDEHRPD